MKARSVILISLAAMIALSVSSFASPPNKKHRTQSAHHKAAKASAVELRKSLPNWAHQNDIDGSLPDLPHLARNQHKNRPFVTTPASEDWSFHDFIVNVQGYDSTYGLTGKTRDQLQGDAAALAGIKQKEAQIVSVTGYLGYAYAGSRESTNYGDPTHHDWHLELFSSPVKHAPKKGDATPIVCETTRFTETKLYAAGTRIQPLYAFSRSGGAPHISTRSSGHPAHKVRITGYLLWDDEHNTPGTDIGQTVQQAPKGSYHHPWRRTPWEIHPIIKIEDLGS